MTHVEIESLRDENGKLPSHAWPGGYQIHYIMGDGGVICPDCANAENGSKATTDPADGWTDGSWLIVAAEPYFEGPTEICDHCGAAIESAYGDPDASENA